MRRLAVAAALAVAPVFTDAAVDMLALWGFSRPEVSEARFLDAAKNASAADAAILQTQIARTWGLRRKFGQARALLAPLAQRLPQRSPEAQARYHLEWGRARVSAAHPRAQLTDEDLAAARRAYLEAHRIAQAHQLDDLAIATRPWRSSCGWSRRTRPPARRTNTCSTSCGSSMRPRGMPSGPRIARSPGTRAGAAACGSSGAARCRPRSGG